MINSDNIVQELKKKNTRALDYLVDNYSNLIFKVCYSVLNDRMLSEECVNDVFLKAWNGIKYFKSSNDKFKKWLMVTAKYTAIDKLRKEVKHGKNVSIENAAEIKVNDLEQQAEDNEITELLEKEINKMDSVNKEIFRRRFLKEESIKEIGQDMGLTESSINNRLLRGKKKLVSIFKGGSN